MADNDFSKIIESVDGVQPTVEDKKIDYEPSSIPGYIAGAGVLGGLGALAMKRVPGLKLLNRMALKTKPAMEPVTRTTAPRAADKVDEIIEVVPTRMERAEEVVAKKPAYQVIIDDFEATKQKSLNAPLTMGGTKQRFGSALYDFVAQHPSKKALPAETWVNEFKNFNRLANFKVNVPGTKLKGNITREELFDTNIAKFNNQGEIVGGFLKVAKESGLPVSKLDLLKMVERSPAANLKTRRFAYPQEVQADLDEMSALVIRNINKADKAVMDLAREKGYTEDATNMLRQAITDQMKWGSNPLTVASYVRRGDNLGNFNTSMIDKDRLKRFKDYKDKITTEYNREFFEPDFVGKLERLNSKIGRRLDTEYKKGLYPRYGDQMDYKIAGAEKYFEDVAYYPNKIPYNRDISPSHFSDVGGQKFNNQLYHVRYGQRSLEGNPNRKVYSIDEMQSDVQQKAFKNDPTRAKVTNPFNTEAEFAQVNYALDNLRDKMKFIVDKGDRMTRKDQIEYYKLGQKFDELRTNTINATNISRKSNSYSDGSTPYMPMFQRDVWGDHALKNIMKSASENNVEWVVVNPVERAHVKRNLSKSVYGKVGNWEFYGGKDGMAGRKGVKASGDTGEALTNPKLTAVIPARMKELAKQYNSEAKTIRVSLSDPNKPFKVIIDKYSPEVRKKLGIPTNTSNEHIGAFKTLEEAQAFEKGVSRGRIQKMEANDPDLYYEAFGIRITPEMKGTPFKLYKKEGGLVVNLFA